jgi:cytochrome b6-f complex iron-sulfur subunit
MVDLPSRDKTRKKITMSIDTPPLTPQQYEVLHGGGAEASEMAKQRLSRRRFLRRSLFAVWGLSATASVAGALNMLYPRVGNDFGGVLTVGTKKDFPAAKPTDFKIDQAGVFYHQEARTYVVHMDKNTEFLLQGTNLADQLTSETIVKDTDGSYWIALFQRCVHLGCTVPFRNDCVSFKWRRCAGRYGNAQ